MLSRTMKFAAVCTGVLVGAALAAAPIGARAADECLTAPKGATPAGAHWYYRLEKGTKRKCWYLADEVSKTTKPTAAAATPSETSADEPSPPAAKSGTTRNKTARKSVDDARAELTTPEDDQPALAATTWPPLESSEATRVPAVDNPAPASEMTAASESVTAPPQGWTMAMRWPESNTAAPQAASAAGEQTAAALRANAAPQEATIDPLRIALIVLTAVLLAAAIAGRLLLRQVRRTPRRTKSRAIWPDQRSDDQIPATVLPSAMIRRRGQPLHAPLDTQRTNADVEEIEALLRASRSATG